MDLAVQVAQKVSRQAELRFGLEPGALLGAAWQGAVSASRRWRPDGGASITTLMAWRAWGACRDAVRDYGEVDGLNRTRRERGVVVLRGFDLPDEHDDLVRSLSVAAPNMTERLEADEAVCGLARRAGGFAARVFVLTERDGLTRREAGARFGVSESYASLLHGRAARAVEAMRGTA